MTRDEWLLRFAEQLGVAPPTGEEADALLALAGTAAHESERTAAPLTCWLVGKTGIDPVEAQRVALALTSK